MKHFNELTVALSLIGTGITFLIGDWTKAMTVFVIVLVCDILTGVFKGLYQRNFSSKRMRKGFVTKIGYFVAIIIATQLDRLLPDSEAFPLIRTMCIYFYIAVDASSVIENLAEIGVPIPKVLREKLAVIHDKSGGQDDKKES